jgi:dihydrodipicolinate synthase/N-acetylneuraminate lyase
MLALGLQYGAYGGIGAAYNFIPSMYATVAELHLKGDWQGSVAEQLKINEVLEVYKEGAGECMGGGVQGGRW